MTVRIAGYELECDVDENAGPQNVDLGMTVYHPESFSDEDILKIRDATLLEEVALDYNEQPVVVRRYNLIGWRAIEQVRFGLCFRWQTYRTTDIEQLRQDNEDLTQALLELAEIIGGGENG